jgi:hypothetical protein
MEYANAFLWCNDLCCYARTVFRVVQDAAAKTATDVASRTNRQVYPAEIARLVGKARMIIS